MNIKRAGFMAVLVVAVAALAVPLVGLRASAAGSAAPAKAAIATAKAVAANASAVNVPEPQEERGVKLANGQEAIVFGEPDAAQQGKISPEVRQALGLTRVENRAEASARLAKKLVGGKKSGSGEVSIQSGEPEILNARSALSAALMTTIGGRDNQFSEVTLLADWDGREDCAADRSRKVDDFSGVEADIDQTLTRTAISEHTVANGFNENIFYYGDSLGNVWVGADTTGPFLVPDGRVDSILQINIPTTLNAFGTVNSDDQITITGLAVSPVVDLTSFANVNGAYAGFAGQVGEVLYVTYFDSESGLRLTGSNIPVRSGLLAFPVADLVSPAALPPGVVSFAGFPVTVGAAFGVAFSQFSMVGGCAVDDDGSVYFQQADLIQFTGANIVKVASVDSATNQDRSLATSGFLTITTLNPTNRVYGTSSGPTNQVNRFTNYSGTSTTFGNIVALATGSCNVVYAAVSRSFVAGDVSFEQLTQGLFPAPTAFAAGTPSMVISFADCSGWVDTCSSTAGTFFLGSGIPAADGLADGAAAGITVTPGVNNFRIFVQGNGPNLAPPAGGTAVVPGTPGGLLKVDMQIDFTVHAGLWVNQQNTVFVISGGTPAGIGKNPSPMLGEVLCFEDECPADRRADFVDLRGNGLPNPPLSGGTIGDGDSDRFDHIFYQSPLDQVTLTPAGLAGLAGGFLRYTNRLAPNGMGLTPGAVDLGVTLPMLGDDATTGGGAVFVPAPIIFENLDPGHQVAGGDDQNPPFRGDDNNGAGTPGLQTDCDDQVVGLQPCADLSGGFEYVFGGPVGTAGCVWNGFFLNSNGNITFGEGDTSNSPTVPDFRVGPPRIAPAWTDLNTGARAGFPGTFPVQALGFANVNAFKVAWINVPQFGSEGCAGSSTTGGAFAASGLSNTFSLTLFDDGTGAVIPPDPNAVPPIVGVPTSSDENNSRAFNPANPIGNNEDAFDWKEGPTDLRFTREPNTGVVVGCSPRPEGSGIMEFDYCRMDLLGTEASPVITGYSIGNLNALNPPGLCEINLSEAARTAETNPFAVIQGVTANICANCCIGEGTEPTLFELFNEGKGAGTGSGGERILATPDFDLRFEGNDATLCTQARQRDLNRGRVCLFGVGCAPPANPQCQAVVPGAFVTTPTTTGLVNALCAVQLNLIGCGFFPNEQTTICQGFSSETGVPLQRPGKTVSTAATLACDTNGDGIAEATIALGSVTPLNCNLVRGTLVPLANLPGTAFPAACCGGPATVTVTTTFTAGDNNVFGLFSRTTVCSLNLGVRAPVVFSVTPSDGNCAVPQDLLISGACFIFTTPNPLAGQPGQPATIVGEVTSVFALERGNPANRINATNFVVLNANLIDALFNFGTANAGKTFLIFVQGTGGISRNLTTQVAGAPAGCPVGNEQGIQVTFTCASSLAGPDPAPPDVALVNGCKLDRNPAGNFVLDIFGKNLKPTADVRVGSVTPRKIKARERDPSLPGAFLRLTLKGGICGGLPGAIVVTNLPVVPGGPTVPSQPFACTERCPAN